MKACSKFELAQAAGVSTETLRRWLKTDKDFLEKNGVKPKAKVLPPIVVKYLFEKYCIDM